MRNYIIPISERWTEIGRFAFKSKLMVVDNVGLLVKYSNEEDLKPEIIRKYLIGVTDRKVFIQGENLQDALLKFYRIDECMTGTKCRAWEIADSKHNPVKEYPPCKFILQKYSGLGCTYYDEPGEKHENGYMICVLDGLDEPPLDCPIDKVMKQDREPVQIGGIWCKLLSSE